ncbi:MAG: hypothetical protein ACI9T9_002624 [Oleiphilaceae bacterium]|jgi:hypothetical protein
MSILSAKKVIDLSPCFLVELPENENSIEIEYTINGYDMHIHCEVNPNGGKSINGELNLGLYPINKITIIAEKEVGITPDIPVSESGGRDFTDLQPYFEQKQNDYGPVLVEAFRRILSFYKYNLNQPDLDPVGFKNNKFNSMQWFDNNGHNYGSLVISLSTSIVGQTNRSFEVEPYRASDLELLKETLLEGSKEELQHQILSDAQSAIMGNNLRRGVFEMAVACELAVKRTFFSKQSFSGDAFEFMEDKGKVKVTVLEFVSNVAKAVFNESFRDNSPEDYKRIDYLFRCRNKIAHRGELVFRDESGDIREASHEIVREWYKSARVLIRWLESR